MSISQFHENSLIVIDIDEAGSVNITDPAEVGLSDISCGCARVYVYITADDRAAMVKYAFNTLRNARTRADSEDEFNEYLWNTRIRLFDAKFLKRNLSRISGRILLQIIMNKANASFYCKSNAKSVTADSHVVSPLYAEIKEWASAESDYGVDASLVTRRELEYVFGGLSEPYVTVLEDAYNRLPDLSKPKESLEYKLAYAATRCLSVTGLAYREEIELTLDSSMREILIAYALASYPDSVSLVCIGNMELSLSILGFGLCNWRKVVATHMYGYTPDYPSLSSFVSYYNSVDSIKISFSTYKSMLFNSSVLGCVTSKQLNIGMYNDRLELDAKGDATINYSDACRVIREFRLLNSNIIASAQLAGNISRLPNDSGSYSSGAWSFEDLLGAEAVFAVSNSTKESNIGSAWNSHNVSQMVSIPAKTQADVDFITRDIHYQSADGNLTYFPFSSNADGLGVTGISSAFAVSVSGLVNADCLAGSNVLGLLTDSEDATLKALYEPGKLRKIIMRMHSVELDNIVDQFNLAKESLISKELRADREEALYAFHQTRHREGPDIYHKIKTSNKFPLYLMVNVATESMYSKSAESRLSKVVKSLKTKDPSWFMTTWRFNYSAADSILPRNPLDLYRVRGSAASTTVSPRKEACVIASYEAITSQAGAKPIRIELPSRVISTIQSRFNSTNTYTVNTLEEIIYSILSFDGIVRHLSNATGVSVSGYSNSTATKRMQFPDFSDSVFDLFLKATGFWFSDLSDTQPFQLDGYSLNRSKYSDPLRHLLGSNSPIELVKRIGHERITFIVSCKDYTKDSSIMSGPTEEVAISLVEVLRRRVAIVFTIAERIYTMYGMQSIVISQFGRSPHVQKPIVGKPFHFLHCDMIQGTDVDLFHLYASHVLIRETRPTTPAGVLISDSIGVRFNSEGIIASLSLFDTREDLYSLLEKASCSVSAVSDMLSASVKLYEAHAEDNLFRNSLAEQAIKLLKKFFL